MTELLHIHHNYNLHEVSHMEAVSRRVKSDVELYFFLLQKLTHLVLVSALLYKASFLQNVVNIVVFTYVIRYKIKIHFLCPPNINYLVPYNLSPASPNPGTI